MVTDVLDSVKFAHWDEENKRSTETSKIALCHAQAALLESIIFHEEGLTLTSPQFVDGVFASMGNDRYRTELFDLMKRGFVNIGIYHEVTAPEKFKVVSTWEYLNNIVFPRNFIFSSMPNLTSALGSENAIVRSKYEEVQRYLLAMSEGVPAARPRVNDGSPVGEELAYFIDFMEEFASVEKSRKGDIYRIEKVQSPRYSDFMRSSLCNASDIAILFNMLSEQDNAQLINELVSCERRSDSDMLLKSERFVVLSCIEDIKAVMNALYNKHGMLAFCDAEIHVPKLATADRRDVLRDVLSQNMDGGSAPSFRFSNTETILRQPDGGTDMTTAHALSMREEISALKEERGLTWSEGIEAFRTKTMLSAYGMEMSDDGEYKISLGSDVSGHYSFHSEPDYDAAEKLDILNALELSRQDSFTV